MSEHEELTPMSMPPPGLPEETIVTSPAPKRRPAAYIAVIVGLAAMAGGAVFFARNLGSAEGGADTPVAAVQRLFDALADEDAVGVLETLLPSERDELLRPIQDITKELGRLDILRSDLDLSSISGVQLDFSNLTFTQKMLSSGVAVVDLKAGTSTYKVDPATSPLGDFVRQFLPPDATQVVQGTDDLSNDEIFFATIKNGDKWYVSLWYSIAEAARADTNAPAPSFGNGVAARGSATPENAVEELIRAAVALDVRRLIELTPPQEARALHDYAPLFIDAAVAGAKEARKEFDVKITTLDLSANTSGDRSLVQIKEIAFTADIPAVGMSFTFDGECATVSGPFFGTDEPIRQCGSGVVPSALLPNVPTPEIGFVAVREGGQWYVSPSRTILDGMLGTLKAFDRKTLDMLTQFFQQFAGG